MIQVICIENLTTKHFTFKKDEIYDANQINKNWWLIDAIGIDNEMFNKFFKEKNKEEKTLKMVTE